MNKEYIKRIKKANDIAAIIGEVVELEPQEGKENLTGWCPFGDHGTHPGQFEVNRRKQIYKCFMCGAGGGVITFVMGFNKVPYRTAVAMLAKRAGLVAPKIKKQDKPTADEINPRDLWLGVWVPNWLLRRTEISNGAKLCYARLCRYYNPNTRQCNPKHETIAEELGVTPRMVRVYLNVLVEQKLIRWKRTRRSPNNYAFLHHQWMVDAGLKKPAKKKKETSDNSDIGMPDFSE